MPHYNTCKAEDFRRRDDTISGSTRGDDEDMEDMKWKVLLGSGSVRLVTPETGDKQSHERLRAYASHECKRVKTLALPENAG